MRGIAAAIFFLTLTLGLAATPGVAAGAEPAAFVEWAAPRATYVVQEPVRLTVRFGVERTFLEENVIQIFGQRLDVPVALDAPALDALPGTIPREVSAPTGAEGGASFVLNGAKAEAAREPDRVIDGRAFAAFSIERTFLPAEAGEFSLPAPLLRFSYSLRFDEDFFNGRVPAEKIDGVVNGTPLPLRVEPWPDEGRPRGGEFTGAVGRFTVRASAEPRTVEVGRSLALTLTIEGEGNCESFGAPPLDRLEGFHVYGKIEEKSATRRVITYDVAPLRADVAAVPPIAFAYYEPGSPGAYRVVHTEAIPLVVRGGEAPSEGAEATAGAPGVDDIFDLMPVGPASDEARPLSPLLLAFGLALPLAPALALFLFMRARERERRDPSRARARVAAAAFAARVGGGEADMTEAFAEYLASRLACSSAAVIAPGLAARLEGRGVDSALAGRVARHLDALVAARYGAGAPEGSRDATQALVAELEGSFSR